MYNLAIIGLGLIGGSLGLALHKYIPSVKIKGYDKNKENMEYALKHGIIDNKLDRNSIQDIDIIFIAVPVKSIYKVIKDYYPLLNLENTLVTDMGSTKSYIYNKTNTSFPELKFIGGHPLAGKEVSGPQNAEADLFTDKKYILIKSEDNRIEKDLNKIINILKEIGCKVILMTPEEHDELLAFSSHLPQIISTSLMLEFIDFTKENKKIYKLIGTGFEDMTRIAASDPQMWVDILLTNKENIIKNIDNYITKLNKFKDIIDSDNKEKIYKMMEKARLQREEI